jgi:hypothetical protein
MHVSGQNVFFVISVGGHMQNAASSASCTLASKLANGLMTSGWHNERQEMAWAKVKLTCHHLCPLWSPLASPPGGNPFNLAGVFCAACTMTAESCVGKSGRNALVKKVAGTIQVGLAGAAGGAVLPFLK